MHKQYSARSFIVIVIWNVRRTWVSHFCRLSVARANLCKCAVSSDGERVTPVNDVQNCLRLGCKVLVFGTNDMLVVVPFFCPSLKLCAEYDIYWEGADLWLLWVQPKLLWVQHKWIFIWYGTRKRPAGSHRHEAKRFFYRENVDYCMLISVWYIFDHC